ncbi:MAG: 16S rRNA (cytidine(1402)-2'-O)-methyltransferase [Burkholderiales bacterium PBB4]|nr:MAG: 16S rRNA (cytidine(1402)-2'-O)-methyltransferase [Burkholderiales bacterium PBB4]
MPLSNRYSRAASSAPSPTFFVVTFADVGRGGLLLRIPIVSASFHSALTASAEAASSQHYPQGTLYVIATPIGNLADISLRALHVLSLVDFVACEDTRHTLGMLRAYGIDKRNDQLIAVHQHNETEAASHVVEHLQSGRRVAYVSDAGTPGISDPGSRLVDVVQSSRLRCLPLPGPSSVTTLLSVAGTSTAHAGPTGFVFQGFLSTKTTERDRSIEAIAQDPRAVVLLEAPHRIEALLRALGTLGQRRVTVGRELTKQFEEIVTLPAAQLADWMSQDANRARGEFSLVIHAAPTAPQEGLDTRVLQLLLEQLPLKTAVKLTAEITGQSRNALYERAVEMKGRD